MSWNRTVAWHSETRLRIRIVLSIPLDFIISNQHLIAFQQSAMKYSWINIQPDFVWIIMRNMYGSLTEYLIS
jgi:hypothetical protein